MTPRTQQRVRALYHYYQLEDLVPEDHILRQIDRAVDFSFVREAVWDCYDHTNGRPGTDPELIVRMILIGYFYGLSENRLRSEVTMHAAYRLFCHMDSFDDPVPDRSTIKGRGSRCELSRRDQTRQTRYCHVKLRGNVRRLTAIAAIKAARDGSI